MYWLNLNKTEGGRVAKILALYLPVLHEGYRLFLEKNQDAKHLFLFDRQFLRHWPGFDYLKKDIRAIDSKLMVKAIQALGFKFKIRTIKNQQDWTEFLQISQEKNQQWILSNDDFGRYLAKKYLTKATVSFDPIFLRWDKNLVLTEQDPEPVRKITQKEFEQNVMRQAFKEASYSSDWWRQVGVIIVKDGRVLLSGYNTHLPSEQEQYFNGDSRIFFSSGEVIKMTSSIHAEALAIARAARQGLALDGADLYVTTFPCPICAKQIASAGIKRLYYATGYAILDGLQILEAAGVEIIEVQFDQANWQTFAKQETASTNIKKCYY